jgi:hypothetical protein
VYCSTDCREANWRKNNPERVKANAKKQRDKKQIYCRECENCIPKNIRKSGLVYCSDQCRGKVMSRKGQYLRKQSINKFFKFKEETGCQLCEYNKYGGSLDFHHVDPSEKEIRITATHWKSDSKVIKKELSKCVLLCKNCHYYAHFILKRDKTKYKTLMKLSKYISDFEFLTQDKCV